ncbi:MAG: SIMPL domain-containing protein [Burkholderiaceae bacterium]
MRPAHGAADEARALALRRSRMLRLAAGSLLAGAALFAATLPHADAQEPLRPSLSRGGERPAQLSVSASAYRDVEQDRVTVTLYAERESPAPATGQTQVSQALGPVLEQLKARSDLEVQTAGYRTDPVWQQSRVVGWRTRGSIRITAKPTESFNRMIGEFAGKLNIESVMYSLSRETQLAVEQSLIAEAVQAFRAKAETATKALGFRSFAVRDISIDGAAPPRPEPMPRMMAMARDAGAAEAAPLPSAQGKTTVSVTVSGTVALDP